MPRHWRGDWEREEHPILSFLGMQESLNCKQYNFSTGKHEFENHFHTVSGDWEREVKKPRRGEMIIEKEQSQNPVGVKRLFYIFEADVFISLRIFPIRKGSSNFNLY